MSVRRLIGIIGIGFVALIATACSGGGDDERVSELEAQVASLQEQLASAQAAAAAGTSPASADAPAATVAPADAVVSMTDFGFTLAVPAGLDIATAGINGTAEASAEAGEASANDGSVAMVLVWTTDETTAQEAVAGAFELVRAASTDLEFVPTNQGDLALVDTEGAFGAFQAERDGTEAGVGIVGGWRCDGRVFSLTVLGADATAVESAFAGLVGGFGCEG